MDNAVSRFWDKYLAKTISYKVPERSRQWYVRRAEAFINAQAGRKLASLSALDVAEYLDGIYRNERIPEWAYKQTLHALQILFVDMVGTRWVRDFDWARNLHGSLSRSSSVQPLQVAAEIDESAISEVLATDSSIDLPNSGSHLGKVAVRIKTVDRKVVSKAAGMFPHLFERLVAEVRVRQYSIRTEQTYVAWVARFVLYSHFESEAAVTPDKIAAFLEYLAVNRNVAASTQSVALNALIFLFRHVLQINVEELGNYERAKKPKRLPVVLSRDEVKRLLKGIEHETHRIMAGLLYGAGLRLMDCVRLRVCDVDFDYKTIVIRDGKGKKDRVVPLPARLLDALKRQMVKVKQLHESDLQAGFGEVQLPNALAKKYTNSAKELRWAAPAHPCACGI